MRLNYSALANEWKTYSKQPMLSLLKAVICWKVIYRLIKLSLFHIITSGQKTPMTDTTYWQLWEKIGDFKQVASKSNFMKM